MAADRVFLALGASFAALAVVLGAFGAHALKSRLGADALALWQTAVQYHLWHALGLLAIGLLSSHAPESAWLRASGWLLTAGIALFSGSLWRNYGKDYDVLLLVGEKDYRYSGQYPDTSPYAFFLVPRDVVPNLMTVDHGMDAGVVSLTTNFRRVRSPQGQRLMTYLTSEQQIQALKPRPDQFTEP